MKRFVVPTFASDCGDIMVCVIFTLSIIQVHSSFGWNLSEYWNLKLILEAVLDFCSKYLCWVWKEHFFYSAASVCNMLQNVFVDLMFTHCLLGTYNFCNLPFFQIIVAAMDDQCVSQSSPQRSGGQHSTEIQRQGRPAVIRCGWLRKQGGFVKTWHSRWFVLRGDQLHYYKDEEETKALVTHT